MANNGYKHTKEDKKRIAEKDANLSNVNEEYRLLKSEIEGTICSSERSSN